MNRVSQQKEGDQNCGFSLSSRRLLKGGRRRTSLVDSCAAEREREREGERGVLRQRQSDYKIIYCRDRLNKGGRARSECGRPIFLRNLPSFLMTVFPAFVYRSRSRRHDSAASGTGSKFNTAPSSSALPARTKNSFEKVSGSWWSTDSNVVRTPLFSLPSQKLPSVLLLLQSPARRGEESKLWAK